MHPTINDDEKAVTNSQTDLQTTEERVKSQKAALLRTSLDATRATTRGSGYIKADLFKKESRVKQQPKYSMQRAQYHSYFGLKPREMPTAGPGAYES